MVMMLVARALERVGDNAVGVGEQVIFVETGLFREFPTDDAAGRPTARAPPPRLSATFPASSPGFGL